MRTFYEVLARQKDAASCKVLLDAFLSKSEVSALEQRWDCYIRLKNNETYQQISDDLKISTATIARVANIDEAHSRLQNILKV